MIFSDPFSPETTKYLHDQKRKAALSYPGVNEPDWSKGTLVFVTKIIFFSVEIEHVEIYHRGDLSTYEVDLHAFPF